MALTYSDWITTYPGIEFVTSNVSKQNLITALLAQFDEDHPISVWGAMQAKAVSYFTAHWLTVTQVGETGATAFPVGQVSGLTVSQGSQSVSYNVGSNAKNPLEGNLSATIYGLYYLKLKRSLGLVGKVI